MGLEINTKEELLALIESIKAIGLNEVSVKMPNLEVKVVNNNPVKVYTITDDEKKNLKKDDSMASAAQILEIFSKDVEEFHNDAR